jgi:signal transduction histidine kinase
VVGCLPVVGEQIRVDPLQIDRRQPAQELPRIGRPAENARNALGNVGRLAFPVYPPVLDEFGLALALRDLSGRLEERAGRGSSSNSTFLPSPAISSEPPGADLGTTTRVLRSTRRQVHAENGCTT